MKKNRPMKKFLFSSFLLCSALFVWAQEGERIVAEEEKSQSATDAFDWLSFFQLSLILAALLIGYFFRRRKNNDYE